MLKKILTFAIIIVFAIVFQADIVPDRLPREDFYFRELVRILDDPDHSYRIDELEQFAEMMSKRLNGTMLIAKHDTILVEHGYGLLHLFKSAEGYGPRTAAELTALQKHPGNQMSPTALFDLASVSKQFTAAAILKLCSEGKMHLSDNLSQYLPELPYKKVTIKQLLTHTAGIPEYFDFSYNCYDTSMFVDNTQLMSILAKKQLAPIFKPGTKFEYVNTNYAILATIVEIVSGQSFETYVHENLWRPAGMEHTLFFTELVGIDGIHEELLDTVKKGQHSVPIFPNEGITECAITRGHWKSGIRTNYDRLNGVLGDKGVYSNVEDLCRWANAYFMEYKIIPKEWIEKAIQCENVLSNGKTPEKLYGYGVRIERSPAHGTLIYHGGLWNGYQNLFLYRPKDGLQIIFLSNYYNASHLGKNELILNIIDRQDTTATQ
ncbi:MAG: beta-lactamase family protein [Bacteroidales bacterium]|nr:beta-lactamase family protein [Bacteroidales bacterium]